MPNENNNIFLDFAGLTHYNEKIKNYINTNKIDKTQIDTTMPEEASDDNIPSTALLKTELNNKANIDGFYRDLSSGYASVAGTIARPSESAANEQFRFRATNTTTSIAHEAPATYNNISNRYWREHQLLDYNTMSEYEALYDHLYYYRDNEGNESIIDRYNPYIRRITNIGENSQLIDLDKWYCRSCPDNITPIQFRIEFNLDKNQLISYNPYGTFKIATPRGILNTNKNLWDEQYIINQNNQLESKNNIKTIPLTTYYFLAPKPGTIKEYDKNGNELNSIYINHPVGDTFTVSDNCNSIKFIMSDSYGTVYNNDICININYPNYNGIYELHKTDYIRFQYIDDEKYNNYILSSYIEEVSPNSYNQYVVADWKKESFANLTYEGSDGYYNVSINDAYLYDYTYTYFYIAGINYSITNLTETSFTIYTENNIEDGEIIYKLNDNYSLRDVYYNVSPWKCMAWDLGTEEFIFNNPSLACAINIKTLYSWNLNDALKNQVSKLDIDTIAEYPDGYIHSPSDNRIPSTKLVWNRIEGCLATGNIDKFYLSDSDTQIPSSKLIKSTINSLEQLVDSVIPIKITNSSQSITSNNTYELENNIRIYSGYETTFSGTLDGKGNTITIESGGFLNGGLFTELQGNAVIKNLNIIFEDYVDCGPIEDSYFNYFGGLAAKVTGSKNNCVTIENVNITIKTNEEHLFLDNTKRINVGGLIGAIVDTNVIIKNCTVQGSITYLNNYTTEWSAFGGLVGRTIPYTNSLQIVNCKNKANITVTHNVGGLLGWSCRTDGNYNKIGNKYLNIEQCANYGNISSNDGYAGGIVGIVNGIYNTDVPAYGKIVNNINYGEINSTDGYASGICGYVCYGENTFNIYGNINYGILVSNVKFSPIIGRIGEGSNPPITLYCIGFNYSTTDDSTSSGINYTLFDGTELSTKNVLSQLNMLYSSIYSYYKTNGMSNPQIKLIGTD